MKEEFNYKYNNVLGNDVPVIKKVFYIEYLIKGGKCGAIKIVADSFEDAERIFNDKGEQKNVLSSIKFIGIVLNGRFYKATETFYN